MKIIGDYECFLVAFEGAGAENLVMGVEREREREAGRERERGKACLYPRESGSLTPDTIKGGRRS